MLRISANTYDEDLIFYSQHQKQQYEIKEEKQADFCEHSQFEKRQLEQPCLKEQYRMIEEPLNQQTQQSFDTIQYQYDPDQPDCQKNQFIYQDQQEAYLNINRDFEQLDVNQNNSQPVASDFSNQNTHISEIVNFNENNQAQLNVKNQDSMKMEEFINNQRFVIDSHRYFDKDQFMNEEEQPFQIYKDLNEYSDNYEGHQQDNINFSSIILSDCKETSQPQNYNSISTSNRNLKGTSTTDSRVSPSENKSKPEKKISETRKRNDDSKGYYSKVFTALKSIIKKEEDILKKNNDNILLMKVFDTIIEQQQKGSKQYLKFIQALLIVAKEIQFQNKYFKILYNSVENKPMFSECFKEVLLQWQKGTNKKHQKQIDQDQENVLTATENTRWSLEKELNKLPDLTAIEQTEQSIKERKQILDEIISNLLFSKKKQRDHKQQLLIISE